MTMDEPIDWQTPTVMAWLARCDPGWHVVDMVAMLLHMDRQEVIDAAHAAGGRLSLREGNTIAEEHPELAYGREMPRVLLIRLETQT